MSVAYYIVLNREEPGFDTFVNGKAVAHAMDELDTLCEEIGLELMESFLGESEDDYSEREDEESKYSEDEDQEERGIWFDADEGISYFDALITEIRENSEAVDDPKGVIADLEDYRRVLVGAKDIEAKWHLAIDM